MIDPHLGCKCGMQDRVDKDWGTDSSIGNQSGALVHCLPIVRKCKETNRLGAHHAARFSQAKLLRYLDKAGTMRATQSITVTCCKKLQAVTKNRYAHDAHLSETPLQALSSSLGAQLRNVTSAKTFSTLVGPRTRRC